MARRIGDLMATRQALAGTRERTRLARELHDSVKQQLFAASMLIGAARSASAEEAGRHLASAERLVEDAKQALSGLIPELRPVASPETSATLYQIAQEAISNAIRHARANQLTIRLRDLGAEVVLAIEDDGRGFGFESVQGPGVGLASMTARAEEAGGSLAIRSVPGGGTRIEARLPQDAEVARHTDSETETGRNEPAGTAREGPERTTP